MGNGRKKETVQEKRERLGDYIKNFEDTYVYIKYQAKFLWVEQSKFFSLHDTALNLFADKNDITDLLEYGLIENYNNICYRAGGRDNHYNLLDEETILQPSRNPDLDPNIKELIKNICGHNEKNIEWLYKAILYKYTHLNDCTIPAVVFFGKGGSGKGTFISLLGTIFGEDNMMANLGQRELTSQFDTYKGQKLVIEFAEVITNNTHSDKLILNKLKNIIGADKITVNEKGVQPYQIENIVWTFISSNSNVPLLLDDKDKGNRRFTLIKSTSSLTNGKKINNSIRDKKIVSDFLAWLFQQYPQVSELKSYEAHDNQEKRDLEDISQSDAAHFWEWFEENFPDQVGNILKTRIDIEIGKYCEELEINDITSFTRWFWKTSKYPKTRRRFNGKLKYCVEIPKK